MLCRVVAKAIVIQKYWRGCFTRKSARRQRVAAQAIVIQKYWRGAATRRRPRRALRAGARSVDRRGQVDEVARRGERAPSGKDIEIRDRARSIAFKPRDRTPSSLVRG